MKKNIAEVFVIATLFALCSFQQVKTLKGTWIYCGDIFNGKTEGAPTEYSLERKYSKNKFESFVLEKGVKPHKYETGNYELNADTCIETQTYSEQESQLLNIPVKYTYKVNNDTLTLSGVLPSGRKTTEFWKRK
ncbi:MAG TPA: hypothetical protein VHA56_03035 [Mucilaginibacter sp.]|nr:hypothetical protein [Mucilaginibacter sp.]